MSIEKVEKFVANVHDKTEFFMHIINLKQTLSYGLVLKQLGGIIKFYQNA